jgi:hypothetical protein
MAVVGLLQVSTLHGQDQPLYGITGSAGISMHAYGTNQPSDRRAPFESRLYANTSFNLLGFRSGFRLTYSTDNNRFRQSMNRIAFRMTQGPVSVTAGDASPNFSRYSMRGTTARGGLVEVRPGDWHISAVGGQSRRVVQSAVDPDSRGASFRQWLFGGAAGYGNESANFARLITVYVFDHQSALEAGGGLTPERSFSVTPMGGARVLDGRLQLKTEVSIAKFTPDTSPETEEVSITDWAGDFSARWNSGFWGLNGIYSRVNPKFRSLALEQTRSDREVVQFQPRVRLAGGRSSLSAQFMRSRDNLDGQKILTLRRYQIGVQSQNRISEAFSVGAGYSRYWSATSLGPNAAPGVTDTGSRPVSNTFMLSPTLSLQSGGTSHTATFTTSYQRFEDRRSDAGNAVDSRNWSGTTNYAIGLPSGWSFNTGFNWLISSAQNTDVDVINVMAGGGRSFLRDIIVLNLTGGYAHTNTVTQLPNADIEIGSTQLTLNLVGSYRLPFGNAIQFTISALNSDTGEDFGSFSEVQGVVRYQHRFR